MYLNRQNIESINYLKSLVAIRGHVLTQTNSRMNGHFLKALRIYASADDRGHPARSLVTITTLADLTAAIAEYSEVM